MENVQYQLFETKGDFDACKFKKNVHIDEFSMLVLEGVLVGFEKTKKQFSSGGNSRSAKAHCLHENVYNEIIGLLLSKGNGGLSYWMSPVTGSERLFFTYNDFDFIIKYDDRTRNGTKLDCSIRNQELDKHIIVIRYSIDYTKEVIQSVELLYQKAGVNVWEYDIPLCGFDHNELYTEEQKIVAKKPRLKKSEEISKAI